MELNIILYENLVKVTYKLKLLRCLPCKTIWIPGRQIKFRILQDPEGNRNGRKKFFICSKKKEIDCPVSLSLNFLKDMVVSMKGHHNHDNNIIKEDIQPIVLEKVDKAAKNADSSLKFVFQAMTMLKMVLLFFKSQEEKET